nr:hypothetical protein [Tanacetum cinerariifolium]
MVKSIEGGDKFYLFPRFLRKQMKETEVSNDESEDGDHVPTPSNDPLPSAKDAQAKEIAALKKKVTKLTKWRKTNVDEMFGVDDLDGKEVVMETTSGVKDSATLTTDVTEDEITMAQALAELKSDNIQAMMDADRLLAERLQAREREESSKVQKERFLGMIVGIKSLQGVTAVQAPPSPEYIPGPEYPEYLPPANDVLPAEEQPLPAVVSPTAESPGYITESEPEMEPKKEDGDDEKSEEDSIEYPTSRGDDDGDDLSEDDANEEDEEESSDSKEEEEEHLSPTVPALALYSFVSASEETEPFEESETVATPPPFGYRVAARISVQPHILMPFRLESEVERLLAIPTPPLSPVSPTSYPLPPFLMPLPIFTPLPTLSFPLPLLLQSTSGSKSIPEADIPLRKRARFTTPTGGYEVGESSVVAAAI